MSRKILGAALALALGWASGPAQAQKVEAPVNSSVNVTNSDNMALTTMGGAASCETPRSGFAVGAGFLYIRPQWEGNPAYASASVLQGTTINVTKVVDFDYDYSFSPIIWASYTSDCGLGVRGRFWRFEQSAKSIALTNDGKTALDSAAPLGLQNLSTTLGDVVTYNSSLRLDAYDLEATQLLNVYNWSILLAGGVRYAYISQSYTHSEIPLPNQFNGIVNVDAVSGGHNFGGVGPTVALEVHRPIGSTGLAVFGSGRGSLLFGDSREEAHQITDNKFTNQASTSRHGTMEVTELEIGVEYFKTLGKSQFFVRTSFVGQMWFGAGNAANNETIAVIVDPEVSNNNANLGFIGLRAEVGFRY